MNEQEKQEYLEKYKEEKEKGVPFFPDILFKDAFVALLVFLALVALAFFVGTPLEARADPADTNYTPRPEWYFLSVFQLLKYFPGELEVVGVVVLPTVAVILLFLLPFLDRGPKRHFRDRPLVTVVTILVFIGAAFLTIQSIIENPPPAETFVGDQTAALYTDNCAGCHGQSITVPAGANLHDVIAEGRHEGMPAWTADLTTDEIDALAGFILSPAGSRLFTEHCGACHEAQELVASDPLELKNALELGLGFPSHSDADIENWPDVLSREERTSVLNFLIAPDGRRLFVTNCASCHGRSIGFVGEEGELTELIREGGLHLEMPPWRERLASEELDQVTRYILDTSSTAGGQELYDRHCARCHGDIFPEATSFDETRDVIATGGSHQTMPVWGDVLTTEQLDALVAYTLEATSGAPLVVGQQLFTENCASCHGDLGEGGENPALPGDVIAPISTAEYLKTRDDLTLRSIIAQGQPNFGMSPFGSAFGGPLDDDQIDSLVFFLRSWEENPPVELPPEIIVNTVDLSGFDIYAEVCSQCHGITGGGGVGPSLRAEDFRTSNSSQDIFDTISQGHAVTDMIAWGAILSSGQVQQLVNFIEQLPIDETPAETEEVAEDDGEAEEPSAEGEEETEPEPTPEPTAEVISFSANVFPILESRCLDCHGSDGGWDGSTYDLFMTSGDHGPVVIPGDVGGSLLAQKLLGTHEEGELMPPPPLRSLQDELIQIILDWIAAGAPDN